MPSLVVDLRDTTDNIDRLLDLHRNTTGVSPQYRKLIAEITLLRLFYILENSFRIISCKAICGAAYLDGTSASVVRPCRSITSAAVEMQSYGRLRRHDLKWTKAAEIKENLRHVLSPSDHLVRTFDAHGAYIDELRRVRNRVAHNNAGARSNFRVIVRRYYGAELNWVTPGTLLLSPRRSPPLIEHYLSGARVLVKTLVRG
jgi:hypothetical protein